MTAASTVRLTARAKNGSKRAALVNKIRERKDNLIGALLLGNNVINILASALTTSAMIALFGQAGVVYATIIMTVLVVVFAEVMPKTYALHHADRMAMNMAPFVNPIVYILTPVTNTVSWIVRVSLRIFGVSMSKVSAGSHLELLRGAIEMHEGPGKKTKEQRAMLRSILDLFEVAVEEIMTHRKNVTLIEADQNMQDIVAQVLDSTHTRLPLWKEDHDNIVGVLHSKLLLKAWHDADGDAAKIRLEDVIMEPWFIPETTHLYDQLQAFRARKEHFAIVVDEYGSFMGVVTLEDILEEIVGEIDDEQDMNVPGTKKLKSGSFIIEGTVPIRDLNREFHWSLPEDEDYSTLAGLILYQSRTIPDEGQSFIFHGFRFDIARKNRNQIERVRVTELPKAAAE